MKNIWPIEISEIKKSFPLAYKITSRIPPFISVVLLLFLFIWIYLSSKKLNFTLIVVIFILIFYIRWIIRWIEFIILLLQGLFKYKFFQKINWQNIRNKNPKSINEKILLKKIKNKLYEKNKIYHRIIIPTYKDSWTLIEKNIESIKNSNWPNKQIIITLAGEERDKNNFEKNIKSKFLEKYQNTFFYINTTLHPANLPNEIPWKGSNVNWAWKTTYKKILEKWLEPQQILVTVADSESVFSPDFFDSLTFHYLTTPDDLKDKTIFQPMLLLFNKFFDAPFFSKIIAIATTFYILWNSIKSIWVRTQAVQSQSLRSLLQTNRYSSETITEDWHQYYRTFFTFNWKFKVQPIYSWIRLEPVIGKNLLESIKLQYNQIKRWSHWVLDRPYIILSYRIKKTPFLRTLYEIFRLLEASVLWASSQFILFFWWIFLLLLPIQSLIIKTFAFLWIIIFFSLFIITSFFIPWKQIKEKPSYILSIINYILLWSILAWISMLFLNGLPALHTHILVLLWKPMNRFNVTIKYDQKWQ